MYHTRPLTEVQSPVTAEELNAWVRGIDESDPILDVALNTATSVIIDYIELELLTRSRITEFKTWPVCGTPTDGISDSLATYITTIEIPYANLITMDAVLVNGALVTDYQTYAEQRPSLIDLQNVININDYDDESAIQMQYQAGFGATSAEVPEAIKTAIKMLAGYIYDHRGSCDMSQGLEKSGAASLLTPYKAHAVIF